ncbi:MAG: SIMPL domain-containing protein [Anaeromyxobacter sp.]
MTHHLRTLLALLALPCALAPLQASAQAASPAPAPRIIQVSGDGKVSVRPDVAVLVTGVEATGKDLAKVNKDANARMKQILAALAEVGVAEKDVQTLRNDIQVERPWDQKAGRPGPITGYTVNTEVRVKVRNLDKLGPAIDKVVAAGSNTLRLLSFEKEDTTGEEARALGIAYAAARVKAEALAKAAGGALGEPLSISEGIRAAPLPDAGHARHEGRGGRRRRADQRGRGGDRRHRPGHLRDPLSRRGARG